MDPMTVGELHALAYRAFGRNRLAWRFRCPACGTAASAAEFLAAIGDHGLAAGAFGQECIGRYEPARGCQAQAVRQPGAWLVTDPSGFNTACFPLDLDESGADPAQPAHTAPAPRPAPPEPAQPAPAPPAPEPAHDPDDHYRHNADADRNRLDKARALSDALHDMGVQPSEVIDPERRFILPRDRALAVRRAAFPRKKGQPLRTASDETWALAAALLFGRYRREAGTTGGDARRAPV